MERVGGKFRGARAEVGPTRPCIVSRTHGERVLTVGGFFVRT